MYRAAGGVGRDTPACGRRPARARRLRGAELWPHITAIYQRAGFAHTGHTEVACLARVDDLRRLAEIPVTGLSVRRSAGANGTRLSSVPGEDVIGCIEAGTCDEGQRVPRHGGWADIGSLRVSDRYRRRGAGSWLLGQAAAWLRLAGVGRLLGYAWLDGADAGGVGYADYRAFLRAAGFEELTRARRGLNRTAWKDRTS